MKKPENMKLLRFLNIAIIVATGIILIQRFGIYVGLILNFPVAYCIGQLMKVYEDEKEAEKN